MITDALLTFIITPLSWLAGLLPTLDISGWLGWGHVGDLDYWLPIHEMAAVMLAVLALTPAFLVMTISTWLVAFVRGASPRA